MDHSNTGVTIVSTKISVTDMSGNTNFCTPVNNEKATRVRNSAVLEDVANRREGVRQCLESPKQSFVQNLDRRDFMSVVGRIIRLHGNRGPNNSMEKSSSQKEASSTLSQEIP